MCLSTPKVPKPTPVIERQPYKDPVSRASLSSGDPDARRRMIAGVATSAQGDTSTASTTRRVALGGDQVLAPVLGSGPSTGGAPAAPVTPGPTVVPQTGGGASATNKRRAYSGSLTSIIAGRVSRIVAA